MVAVAVSLARVEAPGTSIPQQSKSVLTKFRLYGVPRRHPAVLPEGLIFSMPESTDAWKVSPHLPGD